MIELKNSLAKRKPDVEKLANALLEREVLFQSDVEALIGKRPFEEKKSLVVDEATGSGTEEKPAEAVVIKKEEEKSTDELTGNIGLAPSI
jgi:hypothetical protein